MSPADPRSLAFDDVVIDFTGRRLMRAGEPRPLEPKAFAVLALLSSAPGQVFSRDAILDAVWGHRHVTPGVLNRIMTLLRHALGEDAHTPRYLHTLHGVGYRFDLPAAAVTALDPAPPTETVHTSERRARAERRKPGHYRYAPWIAAGALCAALATGWWTSRTQAPAIPASLPAPGAATPTLVMIPLKPIAEVDRDLAAGLSEELITALAGVDGLRVIARESTWLATAQSAQLADLVPRLGISHGLEGSLRRSGERLRVHVRLTEAGSGRTLWTQDYDRDVTDVLGLQQEIAQAVAASLSLRLGLATGSSERGGDAAYYQRYLAARALLGTRGDRRVDDIEMAEAAFRALLRERPEDARSRAGLASALEARAFHLPALARDLRAEAAAEAALALRLDPDLADPYRVQAASACRSNQWVACIELHKKARTLASSDSQPALQFAMALAALGYLDRAESVLRESVLRDPLNPTARFGLGRILDTLGHHEQAQREFAVVGTQARYARWFNAVWRQQYDEAAALAEAIDEDVDAPRYARLLKPSYVATTRALRDPRHWPVAVEAMRKTEAETGLMNFLRVFSPGADPAELIAGLDGVRQRSYSTWDLLLWTKALAHLRQDPAFQDYLRDNGILDYWRRHGYPQQCRPKEDGADCG